MGECGAGAEHTVVVAVVHVEHALGVLDRHLVLSAVRGRIDDVELETHPASGLDDAPKVAIVVRGGLKDIVVVELLDGLVGLGDGEKQKVELLLLGKVGTADGVAQRLDGGRVSADGSGQVRLGRSKVGGAA